MSADPIITPEVIRPTATLLTTKGSRMVGRQELRTFHTPSGTATHRPIPHHEVVEALIETLALRRLNVVRDQYAVSPDASRLFGTMEIDVEGSGVRVALGLRNSHDKSFSLGLTVGYKVLLCDNLMFNGDFVATTRKHTKNTDIIETLALGVERCQRGFDPLFRRVDALKGFELSDDGAKLILYAAFLERRGIVLPRHLGPEVAAEYFNPSFPEVHPGSLWAMEQAFTHKMKLLDPIPRMEATAKLAPFLSQFQP